MPCPGAGRGSSLRPAQASRPTGQWRTMARHLTVEEELAELAQIVAEAEAEGMIRGLSRNRSGRGPSGPSRPS